MGNAISPYHCFRPCSPKLVSLIFWDGTTTTTTTTTGGDRKKLIAGEIMVENPDKVVCHADSFYIGHPIPALLIHDELLPGQTYFVLPIDQFACKTLTASFLASLATIRSSTSNKNAKPAINFGGCQPFQYLKGSNGRVLIKVAPEFMIRLVKSGRSEEEEGNGNGGNNGGGEGLFLCSTPELKKHYDQLVGCREQTWSPKLETIFECKVRYSPCRFIGLEWKQTEEQ
ncbi:hypothetical protein LINGRAHAP2_LOCUS23700 [Linum grandiflorum]